MTDMSLIADLVRAGIDAELVGRVANALMDAARDGQRNALRNDVTPERSPAAARQARYRENRKQNQGGAKANDVAQQIPDEHNAERNSLRNEHNADTYLSSNKVLSIDEVRKEKQARKKEGVEVARARGERMQPGAILTDLHRQAALELGADPSNIAEMWAEHVDYWVAVPGQRGIKLDWLATWRNDVRRKLKMGTYNGSGSRTAPNRSTSAAAGRLLERVRGFDKPLGSH